MSLIISALIVIVLGLVGFIISMTILTVLKIAELRAFFAVGVVVFLFYSIAQDNYNREPKEVLDNSESVALLMDYHSKGLFVVKDGVTVSDLNPDIVQIIPEVSRIHSKYTNKTLVITSGTDGVHGYNSRHYEGFAIDIRTNHLNDEDVLSLSDDITEALGNDFYVLLEDYRESNEHIHIHKK